MVMRGIYRVKKREGTVVRIEEIKEGKYFIVNERVLNKALTISRVVFFLCIDY